MDQGLIREAGTVDPVTSNRFSPGPVEGGGEVSSDDQPGFTRHFTVAEPPDLPDEPAYQSEAHVTTYRAGTAHPQVGGARLAWRPLLAGLVRHPARTFAQMRGHQVWAPALIVSAVYGAVAVFGFGDTRSGVVDATFSVALSIVLSSAVGIILAGLMFGGVTHVLARRLGGDGAWAPTIGFAMIITWLTDAPRLLFSLFLAADNGFVQLLGWVSWLLCAGLLTTMVRELHDLPWGKAAAASALQLIALLVLIKLPVLN